MVNAPRGRSAGAALLALSAMAAPQEVDAARRAREKRWEAFPVFVWFHGGPPPGPRPFATLRAAGLGGCNVEASDDGAAAYAAGLDVYIDHLAGKGDLYLRPPVFERDRAALADDPRHHRPQRPSGLCDDALAERLRARVDAGLARHAAHAPLCYVLDDELSVTRGVNPMDYCFAPATLDALRAWLAERHGTIAALNAAWGSRFASFAELLPPTTGEAREAADDVALERLNFAAWSAHREFMEVALARRLVDLASRVAAHDRDAPIGFTGGSFPSAFGGFDWGLLAPALSLHEPYETGAAPELVHSLAAPAARIVSTLFVPDAPRPGWQPRELLTRIARGDDGVVAWSSGPLLLRGEGEADGAGLTEAGRELARFVALGRDLRAQQRGSTPAPARVFIAVSQAAARAGWMVDSWEDGRTWRNRLTSWESDRSSTATAREGWVELLLAIGLPWRFFDERAGLPAEALAAPGESLVVLGEAFAIGEPLVAELERWVAAGGALLGDAHAALFDESLRGRDGGALARLFGVEREMGRDLDDLEESVAADAKRREPLQLARAEGEALVARSGTQRSALGFERRMASGRTLYLDARVGGCVRGPPDEARAALRATVTALRGWIEGARAGGVARLDGAAIGRVHLRERRRDGRREWTVVPAPALDQPLEFELALPSARSLEVVPLGDAAGRVVEDGRRGVVAVRLAPAGAVRLLEPAAPSSGKGGRE